MELDDLLRMLVGIFEKLGIPYLVTGSVASMAWGEPRLTNDIDVVAGIQHGHVQGFLSSFPEDEFYLSLDAVLEAVDNSDQFNIIHPGSGLKVDVILKKNTPFDECRFARRRRISPASGFQADFASPEDVILKKMEYFRMGGSDKHLRDITGILRVSGEELDRAYIEEWSARLDVAEIWKSVLKRTEED